jgi:hypothetical protein
MQKITKETKAIAEAHILAKKTGLFNDPVISTKDELIQALKQGQTFSKLMDQIELRFASVTCLIMARAMDHESETYKKAIYKGFKTILQN